MRECGRDKKALWEANDSSWRIRNWDYSIVVEDWDLQFNCIAWAAGDRENWWWPSKNNKAAYWPEKAPREETLEAFIRAYATLGFEVCEGDSFEPDYDKIALYVAPDGRPTHAARQLDEHCWSSKLGEAEILCHPLKALEGKYGQVKAVLRRKIDPATNDPVRALGCPGGR